VKERLITLLTALLALGLSLFLLSPPQPPEPKLSVPTSEDRGKAGLKGLAEWLRRQGVAVASLRNRYGHLAELAGPSGRGHVLIVSLPAQKDLEKAEWQALQRWVDDGNSLLILGAVFWRPDWSQQEACFCDVKQLLQHFDWSLDDDDLEPPEAQPQSDEKSFRERIAAMQAEIKAQIPVDDQLLPIAGQPVTEGIERLSTQVVPHLMEQTWWLKTENNGNLALNLLQRSDGAAVAFWQIKAGKGQIFLSLAPDLFSNQRLGQADNARFAANLLNQALANHGKVIFDDYHFGLSELYDPERFFSDDRLHRTLAFLGLMWLLYVAGYSNRLAPVRPHTPKLSMRDFVDVTAGFFARRVPEPALAAELLRQLLLDVRLVRRLADDRQAWQWLECHPQIAPADLAALKRAQAGRRVSLLRLAETLRQVRRLAL
jgi:hypothetical protein